MSGTTANAGIGGTSRRSLALLALGIAALMLPVHYSFYRYSLVGEGGFYALVHGFLACFFAAVYVLLFFAWVQRLTDAVFQLPILAVLGVVGASVVGLYLLVDLFYGTPVYGLAVIVCLAVSGVCWQACPLAAVRADERLRALPDAATVRVWVPLLAAYVLVTLLHALVFSAEGSVFERASAHARLIDTGMVVVGVLFCGLAAAGRLRGVPPQRALTLVIALITMFYVGVCCLVGTPGAMEVGGSYAVLSMMMRTLRVFVFFVLVSMRYRAAAAPASTLGLLFLAVELLADLACYVAAPPCLAGWALTPPRRWAGCSRCRRSCWPRCPWCSWPAACGTWPGWRRRPRRCRGGGSVASLPRPTTGAARSAVCWERRPASPSARPTSCTS